MSGRLEPPPSPAAEPFWEATRSRRLVYPWCARCQRAVWYPREICPGCLRGDLEWRESSGAGVVYACSTMARAANPTMADKVPYVVALVQLAEGPRIMSNVVGCDPSEVSVGMAVEVTWEELSDGRFLPLFAPASSPRAEGSRA